MQLVADVVSMKDEVAEWRRTLHADPELLFDVHNTAAFVAEKLRSFGCDEVVTGIGKTGVVGIIHGRPGGNGPAIRPARRHGRPAITEITGLPWASRTPGKMHACGHERSHGHAAGAARHLAATRNFTGSVAVIFQPAEEGGGGGREMVNDGMMERFGITKVFGMHNLPGLPVGQFAIRKGPIMAATDIFDISLKGLGGHAAMPHLTIDPIVAGSAIVSSLQTIASRNANPLESVVVSVTKFLGGSAYNIIPETVELAGTVRTLSPAMRDLAEARINEIARGVAAAHAVEANVRYLRNYPVTFNHADETDFAADVAEGLGRRGHGRAKPATHYGRRGVFSFMLESRPGALHFHGQWRHRGPPPPGL